MTTKTFEWGPELSIEALQLQLRNTESRRWKVTKIEALDTGTRRFTEVTCERPPARVTKIRLVIDDDATPGEDEEEVCRGTAWIDGDDPAEKVAAFRKKAAAAAEPPAT